MKEFKPMKEGKVREIYDNGDSLIMVATDRISAFDVILKNKITDKGAVLTQMSKFWFDYTEDVVPNHMISVDTKDMPEFFQQEQFRGKSMMCKKLEMLPVECIVRGYITGSGWASYQENGTVCGIKLPEGLQESQQLPEPIYTPSTKAISGSSDVGDVSWQCPTAQIYTATWAPGSGGHTWQIVAQGKGSVAHKYMCYCGKVLGQTAIRLMQHPEKLAKARRAWQDALEGRSYLPIPGEVRPRAISSLGRR